ncbi:MAG: ABC transporter substrate-binding protein [Cetobacterium sp.]|uniref:ABC transporter substrate-binding protein n=1 Tax=Cetobacterium sp. TaxID=2071632 RepID=UPI002FC7CD00
MLKTNLRKVLLTTLILGGAVTAFSKTIEMVSKGYQHEFWKTVELGAKDAAKKSGVEVNFIGPEKESEIGKQVGMVENGINKKVDIIALAALDANALYPVTKKANDAGIEIITFDSNVRGGLEKSFVATDNATAAAKAADFLAKQIGYKGKVAIVAHNAGTSTAIEREKGFRDEMKKYPDIKILNTQFSDGDKSKALAITQDIILANPDLKGVFGTNEGAAVGAARAVEEKKVQDKVVLVGFDSSEDEIKYIKSGVMKGLVTQNPYMIGYETVEAAVKVLNKEPVEKRIDTGSVLVTKDNVNNEDIQKILNPFKK